MAYSRGAEQPTGQTALISGNRMSHHMLFGFTQTWRPRPGRPQHRGLSDLAPQARGVHLSSDSQIPAEEDPNEIPTRWYPWKPSESSENDLWFRRLIFWPVEE